VSGYGVELSPVLVRALSLESNLRPPLFEHQRGSRTNGISKFSVPLCLRISEAKFQVIQTLTKRIKDGTFGYETDIERKFLQI